MALYSEFSISQEIINIQVVINTDAITNDYPNPSKDKNNPTGLPHNYMYIVATRSDAINGSINGHLTVKANVGDVIRWHGVSEYGNLDTAVVIYKLSKWGGETVFNNLNFHVYNRQGILPANGDPAKVGFASQNFWFSQALIDRTGIESYTTQFALYIRQRGVADPVLYGYYYWDSSIEVRS